MIGKILSTTVKLVTLPIDAASIAMDIAIGDDGSKHSRTQNPGTGDLENLRDRITEALEDIDQ